MSSSLSLVHLSLYQFGLDLSCERMVDSGKYEGHLVLNIHGVLHEILVAVADICLHDRLTHLTIEPHISPPFSLSETPFNTLI